MNEGAQAGTQKPKKKKIYLSLTTDLIDALETHIKNEGGFDSLSPTVERLLRQALNLRRL